MVTDRRLGRYLGSAFLVVFAGSVLSGVMSKPTLDKPIDEALETVADISTQLRWSAMIELFVTSAGIVVLGILLYTALRKQNPLAALVALGWWIAEAITLAVSTIGVFLLIPVSEAYVQAGTPASSNLLAIGDTLVGFDERAYDVHMAFFAVGGLVWYTLMYQARSVPRWLSAAGFVVVALSLVATVLLLGATVDLFILAVPTGVFELIFGIWLIVKGIDRPASELTSDEPLAMTYA